MPAFFFTFLAVALAGFGARDQLTLAALAQRQGQRPAALLVALACTLTTCAMAAFAASLGLSALPGGVRRMVLVLAVGIAGAELLISRRPKVPREPTGSLAALGVVLLAQQLTDAARLLVFALAGAAHAPWAAGAGGAVGAAAILALGWSQPGLAQASWVVPGRRVLGGAALIGALAAGFA